MEINNLINCSRLFLFRRKTPQNRVRLDGVRNMERARNQDEMSAIMHGSPVQQARPDSGRKILPHMQRSELW